MEGFLEVAGDEHHFGLRTDLVDPIGKETSAHLRHHQIGQEKVDLSFGVANEQTLRVVAIGRFQNVVA